MLLFFSNSFKLQADHKPVTQAKDHISQCHSRYRPAPPQSGYLSFKIHPAPPQSVYRPHITLSFKIQTSPTPVRLPVIQDTDQPHPSQATCHSRYRPAPPQSGYLSFKIQTSPTPVRLPVIQDTDQPHPSQATCHSRYRPTNPTSFKLQADHKPVTQATDHKSPCHSRYRPSPSQSGYRLHITLSFKIQTIPIPVRLPVIQDTDQSHPSQVTCHSRYRPTNPNSFKLQADHKPVTQATDHIPPCHLRYRPSPSQSGYRLHITLSFKIQTSPTPVRLPVIQDTDQPHPSQATCHSRYRPTNPNSFKLQADHKPVTQATDHKSPCHSRYRPSPSQSGYRLHITLSFKIQTIPIPVRLPVIQDTDRPTPIHSSYRLTTSQLPVIQDTDQPHPSQVTCHSRYRPTNPNSFKLQADHKPVTQATDHIPPCHLRYRPSPSQSGYRLHITLSFKIQNIPIPVRLPVIQDTDQPHPSQTTCHSRYRSASPQSGYLSFKIQTSPTPVRLPVIQDTDQPHHSQATCHSRYRPSPSQSGYLSFKIQTSPTPVRLQTDTTIIRLQLTPSH
ncbi:hypothetical protein Btru_006695 [Bulinus truncatus]|nr:hypothetical protein Btru_006695 [Bulinus truncatus]